MEFATKTIHAGQPSEPETGSLVAPIFQTSTYEQDAPGVIAASTIRERTIRRGRGWRPCSPSSKTSRTAALFASGLAAENAILQAYLRPGDEIVIPLDVYGGTYRILNKVFQPLGCVIRQIDLGDRRRARRRRCRARRSSSGSNRRPIRGCSSTTSPRSPRRRTRPARCSSWTTRSRRRCSSSRSSSARISSCTA